MKLRYWRGIENFGDALNPWLWPRLLPSVFDDDNRTIFFGIGTLLSNSINVSPETNKIVFGTGYWKQRGYFKKQRPLILDNTWKVYCVRGPLTAQALNLPSELAITDSAYLLRKLDFPKEKKLYPFSFMPHWRSAESCDFKQLCEDIGIHFIDPTASVDEVLLDILRSEIVVSEAMHGAIVADALRVPWVPVRCGIHISEFKWLDWCKSLELDYKPYRLPAMYSGESILSELRKRRLLTESVSKGLEPIICGTSNMLNRAISKRTAKSLQAIVKNPLPILSSDSKIASIDSRFDEKLEQFKADYNQK